MSVLRNIRYRARNGWRRPVPTFTYKCNMGAETTQRIMAWLSSFDPGHECTCWRSEAPQRCSLPDEPIVYDWEREMNRGKRHRR